MAVEVAPRHRQIARHRNSATDCFAVMCAEGRPGGLVLQLEGDIPMIMILADTAREVA
jgi:hypothetical protein